MGSIPIARSRSEKPAEKPVFLRYLRRKTPKFQRERIGEFGIGKFSSLSACNRFEIFTKKGEFAATVSFAAALVRGEGRLIQFQFDVILPDYRWGAKGISCTARILKSLRNTWD